MEEKGTKTKKEKEKENKKEKRAKGEQLAEKSSEVMSGKNTTAGNASTNVATIKAKQPKLRSLLMECA